MYTDSRFRDITVADSTHLLVVKQTGRFPVVGAISQRFNVPVMIILTIAYAISVYPLKDSSSEILALGEVPKPVGNLCTQHLSPFPHVLTSADSHAGSNIFFPFPEILYSLRVQ